MKCFGIFLLLTSFLVVATADQCVQPCVFFINDTDIVRQSNIFKPELSSFTSFSVPINLSRNIKAFDFHAKSKRLFWSDTKQIYSSSYEKDSDLFSLDLQVGEITGLAVDWVFDLVFWADKVYRSIGVSDLYGRYQSILYVTSTVGIWPTQIAATGKKGLIFTVWRGKNVGYHVRSTNVVEGLMETKYTGYTDHVLSLAVDTKNERVYVATSGGQLRSFSYSGSNVKVQSFAGIKGVAVGYNKLFQPYIYILKSDKKIYNVTRSAKRVLTMNVQAIGDADMLMIYQDAIQPVTTGNKCSTTGCSHLCLHAASYTSFVCACPIGYKLNPDKRTCVTVKATGSLVTKTGDNLEITEFYSSVGEYNKKTLLASKSMNEFNATVDEMVATNADVYFFNKERSWLCQINLKTGRLHLLKRNFEHTAGKHLQYEFTSKLLYFVCCSNKKIMASMLTGETKTILTAVDFVILDMTISSKDGFIATIEKRQTIHRCSFYKFDGGKIKTYSAGANPISHISYDEKSKRIFWYDSHAKTITSYIRSTNVKNVYVNNVNSVTMMAVNAGTLLWMTKYRDVFSVSLSNANPNRLEAFVMFYNKPVELATTPFTPGPVSSPCNVSNGGCSHMCLRGNNQVYKCACPDDMNIDSVNSKLCVYKTTTKTETVCEHSQSKQLTCQPGYYIHISYAMYGRLTSTICAKVSRNNCISSKSLSVTQAKCQYKQTCTVTATNNWYGDPCTNIQKYLQVRYQCVRNMGKASVCRPPCLYYSQGTKISRVSLSEDGTKRNSEPVVIFDIGLEINSFAVHHKKDLLFWSGQHKIYRSKSNGQDMQILNDKDVFNPSGIVVDDVNDVIYWTDSVQHAISVMSLDGLHSTRLITDKMNVVNSPTSIVIELAYAGGLLFWINNKTPTPSIGSSTLTGANVKVYKIVTSSQPRDLNIDTTQRMLYWLSNKGVERMSYFGTSKKTFVHPAGISVANSLTVSATKGLFYRAIRNGLAIEKFKPSSAKLDDTTVPGMTAGTRIKLIVNTPTLPSYCSSSKCPNGVCLNGGACKCDIGFQLVNGVCKPSVATNEAVILKGERFYHQIYFQNGLERKELINNGFLGKFNPKTFDVDWKNTRIYWYDGNAHAIMTMSFNVSNTRVLIKVPSYIHNINSVQYEHERNEIYWIEDGAIYKCLASNGSNINALYSSGNKNQLRLTSKKRYIFYVHINETTNANSIYRGTFTQAIEIVIHKSEGSIKELTVDEYGERLYWLSSDKLKSSKYDGSDTIIILSQTRYVPASKQFVKNGNLLDEAFGLQIGKHDVYWYARNEKRMYKTNKLIANSFSVVGGISVDGSERFEMVMKKPDVINVNINFIKYTYSYASPTATNRCSTLNTCNYGRSPPSPPPCAPGYVSKQRTEVCAKCDIPLGESFVCQCKNWASCNHRLSSEVTCPYGTPFLRMKSRKCSTTIRSGYCPAYDCGSDLYDDNCVLDNDCVTTSHKCCPTKCGRKCLKKTIIDKSPCNVNNGGCSHTCVTTAYNTAMCQCPYDMYLNQDGLTCRYDTGYCDNNPCFSSTCVDHIDHYRCICNNSFSGDHCQYGFCNSNPCQNGGSCGEGGGGYSCYCFPPYQGKNCESEDVCYSNVCVGNSTCLSKPNGVDSYTCQCESFRTGTYCQKVAYCGSSPCLNGGSCSEDTNGFKCQCARDFVGKTCSDLHPCFKSPCLNGGKCAFKGESYQCLCEGYYAGENCQVYYGDNIAATTMKEKSGTQITARSFKETMAESYTQYCSTNDCVTGAVLPPARKRRATENLVFKPKHIIVVVGYPKVVGQGEVQILYSVLMPVEEALESKLINVEDLVKGMDSSSSIVQSRLGADVVKTSKYVQPTAKPDSDNNQVVIIGAAVGGGVVTLVVLIITIGCCVVKRRQSTNKDVHITMTNPLGGTSVYHGKLHSNQRTSIDSRYTQSTHFGFPPATRSTIGAAPPPPDYPRGAGATGEVVYEGIDDYNAKYNEVFYLESQEVKAANESNNNDNPYAGLAQKTEGNYAGLNSTEESYMGLQPTYITPNINERDGNGRLNEDFLAAEREKSRKSSTNYTTEDYTTFEEQCGTDNYMKLENS